MVRTYKKRDVVDIGLRLPLELRKQVIAAAKKRGVSMNTEMVERLAASFEEGPK